MRAWQGLPQLAQTALVKRRPRESRTVKGHDICYMVWVAGGPHGREVKAAGQGEGGWGGGGDLVRVRGNARREHLGARRGAHHVILDAHPQPRVRPVPVLRSLAAHHVNVGSDNVTLRRLLRQMTGNRSCCAAGP